MDELNREEIERMRGRMHEIGNTLTEHDARLTGIEANLTAGDKLVTAGVASLEAKLSEFRADVKEDLSAIKEETKATNGKVAEHDRRIWMVVGGLIVMSAGTPFLLFILQH